MQDQQTAQTALLTELKQLKNRKGEIARQFKQVEKGSDTHQSLLEQMKEVSSLIDQTETAIKAAESATNLSTTNSLSTKRAFDYLEPESLWSGEIKIRIAEGNMVGKWHDFLQQQAHTPYHSHAWQQLIENVFGHPGKVLVALDQQGTILGGMPLTFFSSKLFGQFAVSIPFINYGGPLGRYKNVNQKLIEGVRELLEPLQLSHVEIRTIQPDLYPISTQKKASMILELPLSDDILEKNLGAKLRSQYKKAEEHNPELAIGKMELLDNFYDVFSRNMRDLGTPVYPKHFFAAILQEHTITSTILIGKLNNKAVSAAFLIGNNNLLEIPWASTIAEANKKNMNMWMYRKILAFAIAQGYEFFDFGRSTIDAGTYKFKKQWGAEPRQHYWYYILPEGKELPEINPNNPKYKIFIALWKLMPVWLSRLLGPLLIKHIP